MLSIGKHLFGTAILLAALATPSLAQSSRPVAFVNARLLTMTGEDIARGTLVVRNGSIEALGADVAPPAGAKVIDCAGGTIMPGIVSAFSRAGLLVSPPRSAAPARSGRRGRSSRSGPSEASSSRATNSAATKALDRLDPRQDVFHELLEQGVTTLALTPPGSGFPGIGATLRPDGKTLEELTLNDDAFVVVGAGADTATKKLLKENFEKAKKALEERKKPAPKPAEEKPKSEEKPAEGKPEEKAAEGKPEEKAGDKPAEGQAPRGGRPQGQAAKQDPNTEVLADLLEGKRRAFLQIDSANELAHYLHAVGEDLEFPRTVVVTRHDARAGTLDVVMEKVKALKASLMLPVSLSTRPNTTQPTNPAKAFADAGIELAFVVGETDKDLAQLRFKLMELVRTGLPRDIALRGITSIPAKMLGVDKEAGTLEVGKQADLVVLTGDPLDPTSKVQSVWLRGTRVEKQLP
jgi:imidazolonepropionase-like amidohydrolase